MPPEPVDGWVIAGMAIIVSGVALTTSAPTRPASLPAPEPEAEVALAEATAGE